MKSSITILFLFFALTLSAQTKTVFNVGYGSGLIGGVTFLNPIEGANMAYGFQYVQRNNRQFVQSSLGAAFGNNIMTFTTAAFVGTEIKKNPSDELNHVGLSMAIRCNVFKGIGLETKYEQSKTSNFYFSIVYQF